MEDTLLLRPVDLGTVISKLINEVSLIQPVNRAILQLGAKKLQRLPMDESSKGCIAEWTRIVACAAHSEAWLSPTTAWSRASQRGPFQGDGYQVAYEREQLTPTSAEQAIANALGGAHALLFRSVEALLHDLVAALIRQLPSLSASSCSKRILASPKLSEPVRRALTANVGVFPHLVDLRWSIEQDEGGFVCFIDESEINDLTAFCSALDQSGSQSQGPTAPGLIIVEATRPWDEVSSVVNELITEGVVLAGIYRFGNSLPTEAAALVFRAYGTGLVQEELTRALEDTRRLGSNIDSLTSWILSLWYKGFPLEYLDRTRPPVFLDNEPVRQPPTSDWSSLRQSFSKMGWRGEDKERLPLPWRDTFHQLDAHCKSVVVKATWPSARNLRTLGKWAHYAEWIQLGSGREAEPTRARLVESLETSLNALSLPILNPNEKPCAQSSALTSSGMGAARTILHYLAHRAATLDNGRYLLAGASSYFEVQQLLEGVTRRAIPVGYLRERDTRAWTRAALSETTMAMLLEPIANAVSGSEGARETSHIVNSPEDLPVIDLRVLLDAIDASGRETPLFLILDTSLFGTAFQVCRVLPSFRMRHNVHILTWSSLQKLHMEGQEVATGGVITLYSGNAPAHRQVMEGLRRSRHVTGVETTLLDAIALGRVDFSWKTVDGRTRRILNNAELLARKLADIAKDPIYHPALVSHPDHEVWACNGSLGIPFVLIRMGGERRERFLAEIDRSLMDEGYPPVSARDSFGFSSLSQTEILYGTHKEVIRFAPGDVDSRDMERIAGIIAAVYKRLDR